MAKIIGAHASGVCTRLGRVLLVVQAIFFVMRATAAIHSKRGGVESLQGVANSQPEMIEGRRKEVAMSEATADSNPAENKNGSGREVEEIERTEVGEVTEVQNKDSEKLQDLLREDGSQIGNAGIVAPKEFPNWNRMNVDMVGSTEGTNLTGTGRTTGTGTVGIEKMTTGLNVELQETGTGIEHEAAVRTLPLESGLSPGARQHGYWIVHGESSKNSSITNNMEVTQDLPVKDAANPTLTHGMEDMEVRDGNSGGSVKLSKASVNEEREGSLVNVQKSKEVVEGTDKTVSDMFVVEATRDPIPVDVVNEERKENAEKMEDAVVGESLQVDQEGKVVTEPAGGRRKLLQAAIAPWFIPMGNANDMFKAPFADSVTVLIRTVDQGSVVMYTLDGTTPTLVSNFYREPIQISKVGVTNLTAMSYSTTTGWSAPLSQLYSVMRTVTGVAYDGYLSGCPIGLDFDYDGQIDNPFSRPAGQVYSRPWDPKEADTTTVTGSFSMLTAKDSPAFIVLPANTVSSCLDVSTGVVLQSMLRAPPGATAVTPLSTLSVMLMEMVAERAITNDLRTSAEQNVSSSLSVSDSFSTRDAVQDANVGEVDARLLLVRHAQLLSMVTQGAAVLAGVFRKDVGTYTGAMYSSLGREILSLGNIPKLIDFSNATQMELIFTSAASAVKAGHLGAWNGTSSGRRGTRNLLQQDSSPPTTDTDSPAPSKGNPTLAPPHNDSLESSLGSPPLPPPLPRPPLDQSLIELTADTIAFIGGQLALLDLNDVAFLPRLSDLSKTAQGLMSDGLTKVAANELRADDFVSLYGIRVRQAPSPPPGSNASLESFSPPPESDIDVSNMVHMKMLLSPDPEESPRPSNISNFGGQFVDQLSQLTAIPTSNFSITSVVGMPAGNSGVADEGWDMAEVLFVLTLSPSLERTMVRSKAERMADIPAVLINGAKWIVTRVEIQFLPSQAQGLALNESSTRPPKKKSDLEKKEGPFPHWSFIVIAGGVLLILTLAAFLYYQQRHTTTSFRYSGHVQRDEPLLREEEKHSNSNSWKEKSNSEGQQERKKGGGADGRVRLEASLAKQGSPSPYPDTSSSADVIMAPTTTTTTTSTTTATTSRPLSFSARAESGVLAQGTPGGGGGGWHHSLSNDAHPAAAAVYYDASLDPVPPPVPASSIMKWDPDTSTWVSHSISRKGATPWTGGGESSIVSPEEEAQEGMVMSDTNMARMGRPPSKNMGGLMASASSSSPQQNPTTPLPPPPPPPTVQTES